MKIISWNINGIRAVDKKKGGFPAWMRSKRAQIVCAQETRALPEQLADELRDPPRWTATFHPAERKGYSGVGTFSRKRPTQVIRSLGDPQFDIEGRYLRTDFGELVVVNAYFPNGNGKDRDNSRIPYKLAFTAAVRASVEAERAAGRPVLVMGDFNTAHEEIDLARPKDNRNKTSGFFDEERDELDRWADAGWVDTFRHFHPAQEGAYTWWSQRFGVRARNVGWRIDYIFASEGAMPLIDRAFILREEMGSDHCPIGIELRAI